MIDLPNIQHARDRFNLELIVFGGIIGFVLGIVVGLVL